MQNLIKFLSPILICLSCLSLEAQLSGSYTIPGSFVSIAAAVNSINIGGTNGPTTINIAAGYTETTVFGGFQLNSNSFPITFQKSGAGANPLLVAYTGGVGTPTSATSQDGIWQFIGCDNIVIDGIDLLDPNTANPAMMEFGYGFFKASSINGCQNNLIKNCAISLNNLNELSSSSFLGQESGGSKGIYFSAATNTFLTQWANVANFSGTNSNNRIYSNKIQNCHIGVSLIGYDDQGYILTSDRLNDVGGSSAATSNTIVNFGGGTVTAYCGGVIAAYQYSINVSNNIISNNNGNGLNPVGSVYGINAEYYSAGDASINNNTITISVPSYTNPLIQSFPAITGINCVASTTIASITATANITINNNVFPSFLAGTGANSTGIAFLIAHSVNPSITSISNNLMQNINLDKGDFYGIFCTIASTCSIHSNTITAMISGADVQQYGIKSNALNDLISNNLISNITFTSANNAGFTGIMTEINNKYASISSNTISNVVTSSFNGIFYGNSVNQGTFNISNNSIFNVSALLTSTIGCSQFGINSYIISPNAIAIIKNNTIYSISNLCAITSSNVTYQIRGIAAGYLSSVISNNKIYGLRSNAIDAAVVGIAALGISSTYYTSEISNNILTDFEVTGDSCFVAAIESPGVNSNIVFNSVYLSGTSSASTTTSYGILINGFNGNGISNVTNNIIVNTIPSFGGIRKAYGISVSALAYYGSQSDRNIIYTGVPGPNRLIANIGASNYSTVASFKSAVYPRDIQTFTENPVFTSTVGSMPNVLKLDPTVITLAESGAVPISGIVTDYAGTVRNTIAPDIGAWEDNYTGFDRVPPLVTSSGFTALPCNNVTSRTFTMAITDASGVAAGSLSPRLYYKINSGSYTSVQGLLTAGTASNGVWTFNLSYSSGFGSAVYYFVAIQDLSTFNNIAVFPSGGAVLTSVTNIITYPSQVSYYILQNSPAIMVNSGGVCIGQTFTMFPSGADTYTFSNGSPTVNPVINSTYTITGTSLSGCISTVAAICNVSINPNPIVTANNGTTCAGQSYTLVAGAADTYTYSGGPVISPIVTSSYSVTGTSAAGCVSSNTAVSVITVNQLPIITVLTGNDIICAGETVTLTAGGALTYTFNPGGTGASITVSPGLTTTYFITGTDANGCNNTAIFTQGVNACTGIKENSSAESAIRLYPNPTAGIINLESKSDDEIVIINTLGQIVYSSIVPAGHHQINLEDLAAGIYVVKLADAESSKSFKMIKSN